MPHERKYILTGRQQVGVDIIPSHSPNTGSIEVVGTYIMSVPHLRRREPTIHAEEWAPHVFIAHRNWHPDRHLPERFFNPRAARLLARQLLEAADIAEQLEIDLGWHPAQRDP